MRLVSLIKYFDEDEGVARLMEIAINERVCTYSGGLGVLAGDTIRSAADLRVRDH